MTTSSRCADSTRTASLAQSRPSGVSRRGTTTRLAVAAATSSSSPRHDASGATSSSMSQTQSAPSASAAAMPRAKPPALPTFLGRRTALTWGNPSRSRSRVPSPLALSTATTRSGGRAWASTASRHRRKSGARSNVTITTMTRSLMDAAALGPPPLDACHHASRKLLGEAPLAVDAGGEHQLLEALALELLDPLDQLVRGADQAGGADQVGFDQLGLARMQARVVEFV